MKHYDIVSATGIHLHHSIGTGRGRGSPPGTILGRPFRENCPCLQCRSKMECMANAAAHKKYRDPPTLLGKGRDGEHRSDSSKNRGCTPSRESSASRTGFQRGGIPGWRKLCDGAPGKSFSSSLRFALYTHQELGDAAATRLPRTIGWRCPLTWSRDARIWG